MSDLAKVVRGLLAADSDVTDIVSQRVSTLWRPEGDVLPCIVIDVDSVDPDDARGLSGTAAMLRGDLTITCMAETVGDAIELAQKAAVALGAKTGTSGGKQYATAASVSTDSVASALDGSGHGPVAVECDCEIYLEV